MNKALSIALWALVSLVGAYCFGVLALHTGESISTI